MLNLDSERDKDQFLLTNLFIRQEKLDYKEVCKHSYMMSYAFY